MPDRMDITDIAFPNLGIYLENVPRKFTLFGFDIYLYGMIIGIGVLMGVLMAVHMAKKEKLDPDIIWDFAIYAVIFSVIGARLYYVAFSWDDYKDNLLSILNTRKGGMAIYGGVIGAFITLFAYGKIKKCSPYQIGDCGVFGLVLGQIIGRWGNFFNREVFGQYTDSLFAMRIPVDAVRVQDISESHLAGMEAMGAVNFIQVQPTFLYEGIGNVVVLTLMYVCHKKKKYQGQMCLFYLGSYGIVRFFVEGIRTDQLLIPGTQLPVSQMLGIVMFVGSVVTNGVILYMMKKKKHA